MTLEEKLALLADGAKYDASCSSSGSSRPSRPGRLGNAAPAGICHSWSEDGRCISLFKILLSNACSYDCSYCRIRKSNDLPRTSFTVEEVVNLTMALYRRNFIEGLFLSSAVLGDPEKTMNLMLKAVKSLRRDHGFNGYIHLKGIPGASPATLREAGLYADRMSVNIELPTESSLKLLAPQKERRAILGPMRMLEEDCREIREHRGRFAPSRFLPAGQTTQMIIGASPESDLQILRLMESLYSRFALKRVYYSAYVPVNRDRRLPEPVLPPMLREHRLYQADWLLRFYQFRAEELLNPETPFLDETLDPKAAWALGHPEYFPLEVNRADYDQLLRVPGIGVLSARKIIRARRHARLDFCHLKDMGVVLKRASFFILCRGRSMERGLPAPEQIRRSLIAGERPGPVQLELFA